VCTCAGVRAFVFFSNVAILNISAGKLEATGS
jgi:hypothetical protein